MTNHTSSSSSETFFDGHVHLNETDLMVISIVAIVVGAVVCLFGKKIFKLFLFVAGFAGFAAAAYYVLLTIEHKRSDIEFTKIELVAIPSGVGLVGGCIVLGVLKLGFFLIGATAGSIASLMLFSLVGDHFGSHAYVIRLVILGVVAIFCGVVVLKQQQKLVAVMSAIGGAYAIFAGADHWVKSGYVAALQGIFSNDALPKGTDKLYIMFGATVAAALVGVAVQMLSDRGEKEPKAGWESESLLPTRRSRRGVNY